MPVDIASLLSGYHFFKLIRNYPAPTDVYRAVKTGYPTLFLKVGIDLSTEVERLSWLNSQLLVPNIVAYSTLHQKEYLLLTAVPGLPADEKKWLVDTVWLVEFLAEEVHMLHSLPKINCPFDASIDALMTRADKIVRHKLIDASDLSDAYRHRTINDLFDNLIELCPATESTVFTHGDLCLPNILIQRGKSAGFVDWGSAGLSDYHRDLALLTRSIRSNLGEEWLALFYDVYGKEVDERKIKFFTLLDQFTMMRCKVN